jgi:hypothetical protein
MAVTDMDNKTGATLTTTSSQQDGTVDNVAAGKAGVFAASADFDVQRRLNNRQLQLNGKWPPEDGNDARADVAKPSVARSVAPCSSPWARRLPREDLVACCWASSFIFGSRQS